MALTMDANTLIAVKEIAQWIAIVCLAYIFYRFVFGK